MLLFLPAPVALVLVLRNVGDGVLLDDIVDGDGQVAFEAVVVDVVVVVVRLVLSCFKNVWS